jgi:hypothetical protein
MARKGERFRVVAEKPHGLFYNGRSVRNPFLIRDVFSPALTAKVEVERRTWDSINAKNEKELRQLFDEAVKTVPGMQGFVIVKVERLDPAAPTGQGEKG